MSLSYFIVDRFCKGLVMGWLCNEDEFRPRIVTVTSDISSLYIDLPLQDTSLVLKVDGS